MRILATLYSILIILAVIALMFIINGCTIKLVQLSPKDQLNRDLEIYQKGHDIGYENGYIQGMKDYKALEDLLCPPEQQDEYNNFDEESDVYRDGTPKNIFPERDARHKAKPIAI